MRRAPQIDRTVMADRAFRCPGCGAINRVPAGKAGTAKCGRCKRALDVAGAPQEVGADELERTVSGSPVPVLVDFWAPWCAPCRMAAPIVDRIAKANAGKLIVLKLDSDRHPNAGERHGIRGVPAFVVFRDGREVGRQVGLPPPAELERWVSATAG
jgi:thioredoxin 2